MEIRFHRTALVPLFIKSTLVLALTFSLSAHAALLNYAVTFASTSGNNGTGSFVWNDATSTMTGFNWTFADGNGVFKDSALAKTIYSPGSARSVGALFYYLFTDPKSYWASTNGLLGSSSGYFSEAFIGSSGALTGDYPPDMFAIGYAKGASAATFEILDLSPYTVLNAGTISASQIAEPTSLSLLAAALGGLAALRRRAKPAARTAATA